MTGQASAFVSRSAPTLPSFIVQRVARFQCDRVRADESYLSTVLESKPASGQLDLKSNDYLALGRHPALIDAQVRSLHASGNDQMMSAFFLSGESAQWSLEQGFSDLLKSECCVVFQSGYQANTGLLQTIAEIGTPVYLDQMAHVSLYQGVIAARADIRSFRHNDVEHLRRQIRNYGPGVVCIDSVYSTDGSVSPVRDILEAAEDSGCALVVDESHSLGVLGPSGAGLVVQLGLHDRVHFRTASLAKAFCGRAGIVACPRRFTYYLRLASPPNIFSSSVLPHEVAALSAALEIIRREDWRRNHLRSVSERLRGELTALHYNVSASASQIIALEVGGEDKMLTVARALQARGVYGAPFLSPATPKNRASVRLSVHAGLDERDILRLLAACADIRAEVAVANWASTRRAFRACNGRKADRARLAPAPELGPAPEDNAPLNKLCRLVA